MLSHYISEISSNSWPLIFKQFAMHYSWDTEERARRALRNVSAALQPGGCFIGTMPDANVLVRKLRDG